MNSPSAARIPLVSAAAFPKLRRNLIPEIRSSDFDAVLMTAHDPSVDPSSMKMISKEISFFSQVAMIS